MASEKIEIDIVLNDGSITKGFAKLNKEAQKTGGILQGALSVFGGIQLNNAVNQLGNSVKGLFNDAIKEATDAQNSINDLANSFRAAGILSAQSISGFQDFAKSIQDTTTIADDQVIALGALAGNYAKTATQAQQLTRAAIELSAATGTDLNSAVEQLGGTLNGIPGRLGKIVPGFKGLSEEALKSGAALDLVLERFGGSAASKINTFAGGISQLKNEFSDFLEGLGNLIIRSPALTAVFTEVANIFREFAASIAGLTSTNKDVLGPLITQAIQFGLTFNTWVIKPFEFLGNLIGVTYNIARQFFDFFVAGLGNIAGVAGKLISFFDKNNSIADALLTFKESSAQSYVEQVKRTADAGAAVFDTGFGDGVEATLARIKESVDKASKDLLPEVDTKQGAFSAAKILPPIDKEAIDYNKSLGEIKGQAILLRNELDALGQRNFLGPFADQLNALPDALTIAGETTKTAVQAQIAELQKFKDETVAIANQVNSAINNAIGNGISSSIQAVIGALQTGGNAFKAFGNVVLGLLGDLAIQLGTFFITTGIAKSFLDVAAPGSSLIFAGAALVALGSLLKGAVGKGAKAASPGSSITPPLTPAQPISDNIDRQQQANIVINGDLLDADSTGLRIANILKEQGFANSVIA